LPDIEDLRARWQATAGAGVSPAGLSLAAAWPQLYPELRRLAARLMASERDSHTLSPTALVHEAWMKLGAGAPGVQVNDRHHFMALACRAMRHILVNYAQARLADKRRGHAVHETLSAAESVAVSAAQPDELLALDQALRTLAREDARAAQVAELRAFGGLEVQEIAHCLGVSEPTVKRDWVWARARLAQLLA
jgi:RNA polymerase sigma factor (TIGR02999 family)